MKALTSNYHGNISANRVYVLLSKDDECVSAEVEIHRPFGGVWLGGEYAIDSNSYFDMKGNDGLQLPARVHQRIVDFINDCREDFESPHGTKANLYRRC